jgi:accessory gene regulator B
MARPVFLQLYARYLQKNLGISDDDADMAAYGIEFLLSFLLPLVAVIFAGWLLGCLNLVLTASIAAACLKFFAGGHHSSSLVRCSLMGAVAGGAFGKLAAVFGPILSQTQLLVFLFIALAVVFFTCWKMAPVKLKIKRNAEPALRQKAKLHALAATLATGSLALSIALFARQPEGASFALAIGQALFWQSFIMSEAARRAIALYDHILTF